MEVEVVVAVAFIVVAVFIAVDEEVIEEVGIKAEKSEVVVVVRVVLMLRDVFVL